MPKQTFFNLPDEKREQILQVAIDEFAENDYESASISRIVARAGIAKGSFYQYFADKEDLYAYLLGRLAQAKTGFLSLDHPDPQHIGVFAYLRWMVEIGLAFELTYPKLTRIGLRAMNAGKFPKAFDAQVREASRIFYRRLVEVGKQQGDIAPDVDQELAAVVFDAILNTVGRYIIERVAGADGAAGQEGRAFLEQPEVKELFSRTVSILEHGMGRRSGG
jgi:TetR/AcrR family transcriptional regulator